jgi:hypothetical protein
MEYFLKEEKRIGGYDYVPLKETTQAGHDYFDLLWAKSETMRQEIIEHENKVIAEAKAERIALIEKKKKKIKDFWG